MINDDLFIRGSNIAKNGFKNEEDIIAKFLNWKTDNESKEWLEIMGYVIEEIEKVEAIKLHGFKTDVQVQITIYFKKAISAENISIKLVSNPRGFNQIDKRWVDKYVEMWEIPADIIGLLKLFTGETKPVNQTVKNSERMFINEMSEYEKNLLIHFFTNNKILVVSDIIKGRDKFSAGWMLVALNINGKSYWTLKNINYVMNVFAEGEVLITERGSLKIGQITMQRKGGDRGRETAKMLQFKINPVMLFK